MATDLTTIFGNEINVVAQPRQAARQYTGFAGAHGVIGMLLGSHGYQIIISGTLAATGSSYNAARSTLQGIINDIEAYQWAPYDNYSFKGTTYYYIVFDALRLITDGSGKTFHLTSDGYVTCKFVCYARALI